MRSIVSWGRILKGVWNLTIIYFESLVNKEELYKEDFDIHIDDELGDILKIKSYAESKSYILFSQDTIDSKLEGIEVVSSLREII